MQTTDTEIGPNWPKTQSNTYLLLLLIQLFLDRQKFYSKCFAFVLKIMILSWVMATFIQQCTLCRKLEHVLVLFL